MNIDYGPLTQLIGTFKGDKGVDIAPDPDGEEHNDYYETIVFSEAGYTINAEKQKLAVVHYHQIVQKKHDDSVIHNQTGYWMWDKESNEVVESIAIPRAVCLLAVGKATMSEDATTTIEVASQDGSDWDIVQSPFMHQNAKTTSFKHSLSITDNILLYHETTMVTIYGKSFEHTDTNRLYKI